MTPEYHKETTDNNAFRIYLERNNLAQWNVHASTSRKHCCKNRPSQFSVY